MISWPAIVVQARLELVVGFMSRVGDEVTTATSTASPEGSLEATVYVLSLCETRVDVALERERLRREAEGFSFSDSVFATL